MKEEALVIQSSKLSFLRSPMLSELFSTVVVRFLILGLGFASTILITRILSVEDRGRYAILFNLLFILMTFFTFGFHTSIVYSLSKEDSLFSSMYLVSFLISLFSLFIISFFCFFGTLGFFFPEFNYYDFLIVLTGVPIILFSYFNSFFFLGKNDFYKYNLLESIKPFLFLMFVMFFYNTIFTYKQYILLFIVVNALHTIFSFYLFLKNKLFSFSNLGIRQCIDVFKNNFNYSAISYVSCILSFLLGRYVLFFIGAFLGINSLEKEIIGYYSVALASMDLITIFPSTLAFFIFPKISAVDHMKEKLKIVKNMIFVCLLFFLLISILSFTVADYFFVLLYGNVYQASVPLFQLLLPTALFLSVISCISSFIGGIGMEKTAIYAPLWGLTFIIISSCVLLYTGLDIYKIIYAQNIAYFIYLILYIRFFIRKWKET